MVLGFLPLVILAAIPTASVISPEVEVQLPSGFFKLKHKATTDCRMKMLPFSCIWQDSFVTNETVTNDNPIYQYCP